MYYNLALGVEALFVSAFFALSFREPEAVRSYPQVLLILMGLCVAFTIVTRTRSGERGSGRGAKPAAVLIAFALLLMYAASLNFLGYIIATVTFFILWVCIFSGQIRVSYAIGAVVLTLVMFFVFGKLFNVPLPEGLLAF